MTSLGITAMKTDFKERNNKGCIDGISSKPVQPVLRVKENKTGSGGKDDKNQNHTTTTPFPIHKVLSYTSLSVQHRLRAPTTSGHHLTSPHPFSAHQATTTTSLDEADGPQRPVSRQIFAPVASRSSQSHPSGCCSAPRPALTTRTGPRVLPAWPGHFPRCPCPDRDRPSVPTGKTHTCSSSPIAPCPISQLSIKHQGLHY